MDGNGRWAQRQGFLRTLGHREGSESVRRIVRASRRLGLDALTLYAFSEQNWERPQLEVDALMHLLEDFLVSERDELIERGIRLRTIGRRHRLPARVRGVLEGVMQDTEHLDRMTLTLALSYGGQEEIADAAREIARQAAAGALDPERVDVRSFGNVLPSMEVGPVDLLVRTSGELRISNFLLWATAYAELHFTERLWPEFTEADLYDAIAAYQMRDRRFGRIASAATGERPPAAAPVASGVHV
ncbi:MAG: di-trans,poly-cis-decaprenylcistransferase [Sandaracinaceae bacterium]|nr:di-trans,poly-cis-decaprenylcistransferase [Sandaracinaceae bacterium]